MKRVIVSIYDTKAMFFANPWTARNEGEAIRLFTSGINDKETQLNKHPTDFNLYYVGTFDDEIGTIEPAVPRLIIAGSSVDLQQ